MHKRLKRGLLGYILVGVLLAGSAAGLAYDVARQTKDPEGVFWDSIREGMMSSGITCTVIRQSDDRTSIQDISLDLAGKTDARTRTTLTQSGSKVVTEGLVTERHDYVRYISIQSDRASQPDFSKVIDTWGKESRAISGTVSMYDQTTLGGCVVPLGNLSRGKADSMVADMRKHSVLKTSAANSVRDWNWEGVSQRYEVTVPAAPYVHFMKQFAATTGQSGLNGIVSTDFKNRNDEKLVFHVDVASRRLERIEYAGRKQSIVFSNFGVKPDTRPPTNSIPAAELQDRLKAAK